MNSILANFSKVQNSKFSEMLNMRKWRRGPPSYRLSVVPTTVCTELSATIAELPKYQLPFLLWLFFTSLLKLVGNALLDLAIRWIYILSRER